MAEAPVPRHLITDPEIKDALKQALREWLDEKFSELGKWSFRTFTALALGALVYFILQVNGWHK